MHCLCFQFSFHFKAPLQRWCSLPNPSSLHTCTFVSPVACLVQLLQLPLLLLLLLLCQHLIFFLNLLCYACLICLWRFCLFPFSLSLVLEGWFVYEAFVVCVCVQSPVKENHTRAGTSVAGAVKRQSDQNSAHGIESKVEVEMK